MYSSSLVTDSHYVFPGVLSIGIQPLAVCQSMGHGHSAEAVTADTLFEKMCLELKSNLVCESKELDLRDVASIKVRCD